MNDLNDFIYYVYCVIVFAVFIMHDSITNKIEI